MISYNSKSRDTGMSSGVAGYEYGDDYITIYFGGKDALTAYTYTYKSCGAIHVERMKSLADVQHGLSTYVSRHHPRYAAKHQ